MSQLRQMGMKLFTRQHRAAPRPWTIDNRVLPERSECTRDHRCRRRRAAGRQGAVFQGNKISQALALRGMPGGGGADRRSADRRAEVVRRFKIDLFGSRL